MALEYVWELDDLSFKLFSCIFIFLAAIIGVYMPMFIGAYLERSIPILTAFAGGICLSVGMCHLLVDASKLLRPVFGDQSPFIANFLCVTGFVMLLVIEQLADSLQFRESTSIPIESLNSQHSELEGCDTTVNRTAFVTTAAANICCQGFHPHEYTQPLDPYTFIPAEFQPTASHSVVPCAPANNIMRSPSAPPGLSILQTSEGTPMGVPFSGDKGLNPCLSYTAANNSSLSNSFIGQPQHISKGMTSKSSFLKNLFGLTTNLMSPAATQTQHNDSKEFEYVRFGDETPVPFVPAFNSSIQPNTTAKDINASCAHDHAGHSHHSHPYNRQIKVCCAGPHLSSSSGTLNVPTHQQNNPNKQPPHFNHSIPHAASDSLPLLKHSNIPVIHTTSDLTIKNLNTDLNNQTESDLLHSDIIITEEARPNTADTIINRDLRTQVHNETEHHHHQHDNNMNHLHIQDMPAIHLDPISASKAASSSSISKRFISSQPASPDRRHNHASHELQSHHEHEGVHEHDHGAHSILTQTSKAVAAALFAAFSTHSTMEGLGLGVADGSSAHTVAMAILGHKVLEGFALGSTLANSASKRVLLIYASLFSLMTPLGILLGAWISMLSSNDGNNSSVGKGALSGIAMGVASGTFAYVSFYEVIPRAFRQGASDRWLKIGVLLGGVGIIVGQKLIRVMGEMN